VGSGHVLSLLLLLNVFGSEEFEQCRYSMHLYAACGLDAEICMKCFDGMLQHFYFWLGMLPSCMVIGAVNLFIGM